MAETEKNQKPKTPAAEPQNTPAPIEEEYFFSGGLEFIPITVKATSREEAEKKWITVRVPTDQKVV